MILTNDEETRKLLSQIQDVATYLESATTLPATSLQAPAQPAHAFSSPRTHPAPTTAAVLSLPRGTPSDTVRALVQMGQRLRSALDELSHRVDAQMVEFFDHLREKEFHQLSEIADRQRVVPEGFHAMKSRDGGGLEDTGATDDTTTALRRLADSRRRHPSPPAVLSRETRRGATPDRSQAVGQLESLRTHSEKAVTEVGGRLHGLPLRHTTTTSARTQQANAERDMASVLQAHLHLLLESALTQADGTCAAVFIRDSERQKRTAAPSGACPTQDTAAEPNLAPRFLHCIAKLNADGKLPDEISYASMNALVSVTTTGVAANMANMDTFYAASVPTRSQSGAPRGQRAGDLHAAPSPTDAAAQHWAVKHLNVRNCVIVPLRRYGCLIIADKNPRAPSHRTGGSRFTLFDEHISWATALLCDGVLTRYRRDLLLQHSWLPPAGIVSVLKPAALLNSIPVHAAEAFAGADRHSRGTRRTCPGDVNLTDGLSDKAIEVLAYMDGARMEATADGDGGVDSGTGVVAQATHDVMPKVLTVVRTCDENHKRMVELFTSSTATSSPPAAHITDRGLSEEDLFQAASDYIHRLETLWRDSLTASNAHQGVTALYERQLERKDDAISALESRVQTLTARLVHVEQQLAAASASPDAQVSEPSKRKPRT